MDVGKEELGESLELKLPKYLPTKFSDSWFLYAPSKKKLHQ
jgi:hypothetical protein